MSVIHPGCAGQTPYPNFHTKKNIIYSQLNGKTNKLYSFVGASYVIHIGGARRQDAAWHQSPLEKNPTERTVIQHLSKSTALWWVTRVHVPVLVYAVVVKRKRSVMPHRKSM